MSGAQHTPGRLEVREQQGEVQVWSVRRDGGVTHSECVAVINGRPDALTRADAERIVQCVNAHDELIDMLRSLLNTRPTYSIAYGREEDRAKALLAKVTGSATPAESLFYLQDTRSYVGNCPMWWAQGGNGYTTDLRKAQRYTLADAMRQHEVRDTDLPWACADIDPLQRPTVDMQDMRRIKPATGSAS